MTDELTNGCQNSTFVISEVWAHRVHCSSPTNEERSTAPQPRTVRLSIIHWVTARPTSHTFFINRSNRSINQSQDMKNAISHKGIRCASVVTAVRVSGQSAAIGRVRPFDCLFSFGRTLGIPSPLTRSIKCAEKRWTTPYCCGNSNCFWGRGTTQPPSVQSPLWPSTHFAAHGDEANCYQCSLVCLCVGHIGESCKTAETIEAQFGADWWAQRTADLPRERVLLGWHIWAF